MKKPSETEHKRNGHLLKFPHGSPPKSNDSSQKAMYGRPYFPALSDSTAFKVISGVNAYELLRRWPRPLRECAFGFLYWLGFLIVLEPDNALRAFCAGHAVAFGHEVGRILAASLLGALATPVVMSLTRRFPVPGNNKLRHILIHLLGAIGMAFSLIAVSCFLAAWIYQGAWLPTLPELRNQLISNWLLLTFALVALTAIAHAIHFFHYKAMVADFAGDQPNGKSGTSADNYLTQVLIKTRGQSRFIDLAGVDWIETQGNYLALHVGSATHLIRETSVKFEARLDPSRFVRIHRRVIVAVDRIRSLQPMGNGDAVLTLVDNSELRASRNYRDTVRQRWADLNET